MRPLLRFIGGCDGERVLDYYCANRVGYGVGVSNGVGRWEGHVFAMRVNQLLDFPKPNIVLHCNRCGADSSAIRGDYWQFEPNYTVKCRRDRTVMVLARKEVRYIEVTVEEADDGKEG